VPSSGDHTFVFLDLAGFTALTEAHGDDYAADVAEDFVAGVRRLLPEHEAREVKTMGDAAMLHLASAERAICLAECAIGDLGAKHGALGVRVGMHTGPAVTRDGDWFGATVNIASRVAAEASADEALVTGSTVAAATGEHDLRPLGARALKNVSAPVELFALVVDTALDADLVIDPVCRMAVLPAEAAASVAHDGVRFHFCSAHCAATFGRQPDFYAGRHALATP
jgi:class 3 adenylate cyclase/YHS domain-containing protein